MRFVAEGATLDETGNLRRAFACGWGMAMWGLVSPVQPTARVTCMEDPAGEAYGIGLCTAFCEAEDGSELAPEPSATPPYVACASDVDCSDPEYPSCRSVPDGSFCSRPIKVCTPT